MPAIWNCGRCYNEEVCLVGSMTRAAEPTFLPALSEVYSPVFVAGGGG